jgi:hypothetical protein
MLLYSNIEIFLYGRKVVMEQYISTVAVQIRRSNGVAFAVPAGTPCTVFRWNGDVAHVWFDSFEAYKRLSRGELERVLPVYGTFNETWGDRSVAAYFRR